jgi:hypothetical protein
MLLPDGKDLIVFLGAQEKRLLGKLLGERQFHEVDWLHQGEAGRRSDALYEYDRLCEVVDVFCYECLCRGRRLESRWGRSSNWGDEHDVSGT